MKINQVAPLLIYDCVLLFHAQDEQGQNYMFSHVGVCEGFLTVGSNLLLSDDS